MKFVNIKFLLPLLMIGLLFTACDDEPFIEKTEDELFTVGGTLPLLLNVNPGFFDLGDPMNANVAFDTDASGAAASSGDLMLSYSGAAGAIGPVSLGSLSIPSNSSVSLADAAAALGINMSDVAIGDVFTMQLQVGGSKSGARSITASCFSALAGTYNYVSSGWCGESGITGSVDLTENSSGRYTFSDWSFGAYPACYDGFMAAAWGSLELTDVCNQLAIAGEDNYGDTWDISNVSTSGADLTFSWANTYGEAGTVTLTRGDGSDWPPLYN